MKLPEVIATMNATNNDVEPAPSYLNSAAYDELVRSSVRDARRVISNMERLSCGLEIRVEIDENGFQCPEPGIRVDIKDSIAEEWYTVFLWFGLSRQTMARKVREAVIREREEKRCPGYYRLLPPDWMLAR
jgi:hypothetical protein